jgi:hypothetical protein
VPGVSAPQIEAPRCRNEPCALEKISSTVEGDVGTGGAEPPDVLAKSVLLAAEATDTTQLTVQGFVDRKMLAAGSSR